MLTHDQLLRLCTARDRLREGAQSLDEISTGIGLSKYHFVRQFRTLFGETPHQFRIRCRMEQAKQLIVIGQQSITEICIEVGYSSLGSFSAHFSRRYGESPH